MKIDNVRITQSTINRIKQEQTNSIGSGEPITKEQAMELNKSFSKSSGINLSVSGVKLATSSFIGVERFKFTFDNSKNVVGDITQKYAEYRNNIIEVCENDAQYKNKKEELLGNLDKQFDNLINHYSNYYLDNIQRVEDFVNPNSTRAFSEIKKMGNKIQTNKMSSIEKAQIKADFINLFNNARDYVKKNNSVDGLTDEIISKNSRTINSKDLNQLKSKTNEMLNNIVEKFLGNHYFKLNEDKVTDEEKSSAYNFLQKEEEKRNNYILNLEGSDYFKNLFQKFLNFNMV